MGTACGTWPWNGAAAAAAPAVGGAESSVPLGTPGTGGCCAGACCAGVTGAVMGALVIAVAVTGVAAGAVAVVGVVVSGVAVAGFVAGGVAAIGVAVGEVAVTGFAVGAVAVVGAAVGAVAVTGAAGWATGGKPFAATTGGATGGSTAAAARIDKTTNGPRVVVKPMMLSWFRGRGSPGRSQNRGIVRAIDNAPPGNSGRMPSAPTALAHERHEL